MKKFKIILNSGNLHGKFLMIFFAALFGFQQISAQEIPPPAPSVKIKITPKISTTVEKPVLPKPYENKKVVRNTNDTAAEKSIVTESKVNITLCVKEGNVRINGWERDEVRAFVEGGSQVGFKIVQENPKTKKPVWLYVLGFDPSRNKEVKPEDCLSGREIELDVPRNSSIKLKSGESEIKIESIAKVSVESLGGDIYLNDIANGIDVSTYGGDLTVENSNGQIMLANAAGNIIAIDLSPSEIGDTFKAKTNSGRIVLKGVEQRQLEASSTNGSINYNGELLGGGQYVFSANNGSINIEIPLISACNINALFGFGAFNSEVPMQNVLKKERSLSAQIGAADSTCSMNLTTSSGVIKIRKKP